MESFEDIKEKIEHVRWLISEAQAKVDLLEESVEALERLEVLASQPSWTPISAPFDKK